MKYGADTSAAGIRRWTLYGVLGVVCGWVIRQGLMRKQLQAQMKYDAAPRDRRSVVASQMFSVYVEIDWSCGDFVNPSSSKLVAIRF